MEINLKIKEQGDTWLVEAPTMSLNQINLLTGNRVGFVLWENEVKFVNYHFIRFSSTDLEDAKFVGANLYPLQLQKYIKWEYE